MAENLSGAVKPSSIEQSEHVDINDVRAKRVLVGGSDGSDIQDVLVDANGHLQVDVLTGGGGGTQYDDGEARGDATGTIAMGDDGTNIQSLKCDANGVLAIQDNGGAVTVDGTVAVTNAGITSIDGKITACNTGAVVISSGSVTVSATDLDVRNLTSTDVVTVTGGAGQTADVKVTLDSETVPVTGTFWQATQPVSIASMPSTPVTGTFWQETQPVSGTVAVTNAGITSIDGKITACNTGAVVVSSGSITADLGVNNDVTVTNATATNLKAQAECYQGGSAVAAANGLYVRAGTSATFPVTDNSGSLTVDNAGTFAVQASIPVSATRVQGKVDNADTTTARQVLAAIASNYVYITSFIISVAAAGNYWLEDGDAAQITPKFYLAANGGVSWTAVNTTPYKTTTVNKAINVKGSTAGAVGVMLTGYSSTT